MSPLLWYAFVCVWRSSKKKKGISINFSEFRADVIDLRAPEGLTQIQ